MSAADGCEGTRSCYPHVVLCKLGGVGAFALLRTLQSQLFGVAATDPVVLVTVTGQLALVAVLACVLSAGRATRIDSIVALTE